MAAHHGGQWRSRAAPCGFSSQLSLAACGYRERVCSRSHVPLHLPLLFYLLEVLHVPLVSNGVGDIRVHVEILWSASDDLGAHDLARMANSTCQVHAGNGIALAIPLLVGTSEKHSNVTPLCNSPGGMGIQRCGKTPLASR